jgi:hypothetical protein
MKDFSKRAVFAGAAEGLREKSADTGGCGAMAVSESIGWVLRSS